MKKIFTCLMVAVMLLGGIRSVSAMSYNESYTAAKNYFLNKTELQGYGEVITYASLGLDASQLEMKNVINTQYASSIAQTAIALVLHGDDPNNYNGINYVEMVENCVQESGAFDKTNDSTFANYQISGVNALYMIQSDKTNIAADYLASLQNSNGSFGSSFGESLDITAWAIETLSIVDITKYQSVIDKAITYINSKLDGNAGYQDSYSGVNINTQACVLMGILTYDAQGIKDGRYNQNGINPYDVLLTYQNNDGSFWYQTAGEDNYYATIQGIQTVGYYYNGSIYHKVQKLYQELIHKEEKPKTENSTNQEYNINKDKNNSTHIDTDKNQSVKPKIVETADSTELLLYLGCVMISGLVILKGKKYFE